MTDELKAAAAEVAESELAWLSCCECEPTCEECGYRRKVKALADFAACEAARTYGSQGETPDGLSVDNLLRAAIKAAKGEA